MPQPKHIALILALAGALAVNVGMSGCRKCYNCFQYSGVFVCYKGTDTIQYEPFGVTNPTSYTSQGYICDTIALLWEQTDGPGSEPACPEPKNLGPGDSCALIQ